MIAPLPEPYWLYTRQGSVLFARSAWAATVYRRRRWWFNKRVAEAAGWTENEAFNNALDKMPEADFDRIRATRRGES